MKAASFRRGARTRIMGCRLFPDIIARELIGKRGLRLEREEVWRDKASIYQYKKGERGVIQTIWDV
jgi:hypothetical protein